ncbi:MAG: glutamine--fructose-6-phosphate transaminase (isomerizing) [Acidobacteria bacterium]|nr:glutamine--fructose-6-phosphate transaminase (isomerizing) [Acidobacteriota bacterium]MDA1234257.1 glutamine--fructose-6-phosphate transaminase (isomerizing) [Acidobacteriota bacterium]
MCGIVGYIGPLEATPIIIDGLRRLEYRGYDSAGIAVGNNGSGYAVRRAAGKLRMLEEAIRLEPVEGKCGIGHTRWATHGQPTKENAHPHRDASGDIVVVHNGIIENYLDLRAQLKTEGYVFVTDTDSEIIAHLLDKYSRNSGVTLESALMETIERLHGVFSLATVSRRDPGKIVVARQGPPAIIGLGQNEYFVASDTPAILHHTRDIIFLADGDMAVLTADGVRLTNFQGQAIERPVQHVAWDPVMAEKGGYKHFMLKEMYEQPRAVRETMVSRVNRQTGEVFLDNLGITPDEMKEFRSVRIAACGTSWHAALAGKFMIEKFARVPVEVDYGSEFRYRDPILDDSVLTIVITQSGETADTLAAQREAVAKGSPTIAICNVIGAMITRETKGTIYTHAGPEIGVASTKAFTSQLAALFTLAMYMGQVRGRLDEAAARKLVGQLFVVPNEIEEALRTAPECEALAQKYHKASDFLFLGRGIHYPIALEGALKLKEISYIHAEGYPAGEMKHGPNALIDEELPVVVIATYDPEDALSRTRYEKTVSNIQEVQARRGRVIAIANRGDEQLREMVEDIIEVPATHELLLPMIEIVPLQLLAYYIAVVRGCDVDQPRNLAKSVTVE